MTDLELKEAFHRVSAAEFKELAHERMMREWRETNRFCGKCGAAMTYVEKGEDHAYVCPKCAYRSYPKISPAVIVVVTRGNAILLQRNTHYKVPYWTLPAGFVDPGETLEEAVHREVREESGIEIANLRYFGSQAWPFPSNMMIGYHAEWASGEIRPDGEEVVEAGWFDRDALPDLPRPNSLARKMIDAWKGATQA